MTIEEAKIVLAKEYHIDNFTYLAKDVLLPDYAGDVHDVWFKNDIFSTVKQLGTSDACELTVFEVYLKEGTQNRRVAITQEMFKILRGLHINNALVAFVNANEKNFRISLLTSKYEFNGDKIVKVLSNPRRFSYTLGIGMKTKTAYKFLIEKGKVKDLNELVGRFSVEVVNKQFYAEIATAFTELVGGERNGKTYTKLLQLYGSLDHNKHAEFGVRLIGRIMFCWFLREKRSESGIPLVPDDMLSTAKIDASNDYYHQVLEPLFFELLNTPINSRKRDFDTDYYNKIPYLNGGLFSPHTDDMYRYDPILHGGRYGQVTIPNEWFKQLYQTLGQYNFTVDENTAYDIELSIDPEMLGRIFENLLAEINPETGENAKKSTGSFYTPRDIVDYMVDSSLCEYLKTKTGIDEVKLKALISYSKEDEGIAVFDTKEKKSIIEALYTVTVLDPACGSGAFPIGMLQKIVYILQEIDPGADLWFDAMVKGAPIYVRQAFEKKFRNGELDYLRKITVIERSIYGIDIQPIAVEISRLRCFLSLIIEEKVDDAEENRNIKVLPNLDFKFIIANSLIPLERKETKSPMKREDGTHMFAAQISLFEEIDHIDKLKEIREEFFNAKRERRQELKLEFIQVQQDMLVNTITQYNKQASKKYQQLSEWKPFENKATDWFDPEWMFGLKDGFDIVIGNPPYGVKFQETEKKFLGQMYPFVPDYESADYFLERSWELLTTKGVVNFIIPNTFLANQFAKKFRINLLKKWGIQAIYNLSQSSVFENVSVRNAIIAFNKDSTLYGYYASMEVAGFGLKIVKSIAINKEFLNENIGNWLNLLDINIDTRELLKKIRNGSSPLNTFCSVSQGLIPYDKYRGHSEEIIKNKIWNASYKKDDTYKKELQGKDISRYVLVWNGTDWLSYGNWLAAPRRREFFTEPRLLIREITNPRILATYTDEEYYNTPSIINCIEFKNVHPFYILAILNSSLMSYYHIKSSPKAGKGLFPKILVSDVRKIPIQIDHRYQDKLVSIVKRMLNFYDNSLEDEIDNIVYKIYGLNEDDIKIIKSFWEGEKEE